MEQTNVVREGTSLEECLGTEWYNLLKDEFEKDYMKELIKFVTERRAANIVYPPKGSVFNAYKWTPYDKVKVCIVGQDPYINPFEAEGIAFSTFNNQSTPSLRRIENAIKKDVKLPDDYKWSNNLKRWSDQGVFLLNTVLTVDAGKSNSHTGKGWEIFTLETVKLLDSKGIIFLLWGKQAQGYKGFIKNSIIIEAEHPVAGVYRGQSWQSNDCFNKVNEILTDNKINW